MVRETPLHAGHLTSMLTLSQLGAVIAPPVPAMYTRPRSIDDIVAHSVGRALDLFDIETASRSPLGRDLPAAPNKEERP